MWVQITDAREGVDRLDKIKSFKGGVKDAITSRSERLDGIEEELRDVKSESRMLKAVSQIAQ